MSDESIPESGVEDDPATEAASQEPGKSAGQIAYESFYRATGNQPSWEACPVKRAWEKAAKVVLECSPN